MDCSDKIIHCEAMADIANKVQLWIVLTKLFITVANKDHLWIALTKLFIACNGKLHIKPIVD